VRLNLLLGVLRKLQKNMEKAEHIICSVPNPNIPCLKKDILAICREGHVYLKILNNRGIIGVA
jgi:hypothetical protein